MPTRTKSALCFVTWTGAAIVLIPVNSQAEADLSTGFTADGAKTTVAITQVDAGRAGYGATDTKAVQLALS